jgi:Fur family zinc uptake transcriptional regulator
LAQRIKDAGETGDVVGVYRTLETLEQQQLVHRILTSGKYAKCQLGPEDACGRHQLEHCHHNMVCRTCGRTEEVHCPGVGLLMQALAAQSTFRIESHSLEFSGLCAACQD